MNEYQLTVLIKYEFDKPLIQKIDSIIDFCIRDCHNKHFHRFEYKCKHDNNFTSIRINEINNTTISDKSMRLYELKKQLLDKMVLNLIK